ncbi:hypothetical protein [Curtobacterium sp. VKM Ac-2884]|uniref:hypothetical protein n=1 Tax=Curtobacterium sp. VKM Ac-2884 TaxID=2783818 RepID=UPI00188A47A4|nr:hypothetical protein [Curtobacterium sp. VKM Ac-2884]MBF4602848.1 hypothetical protein [Curtobacterium sp. VKM Ac-2884]
MATNVSIAMHALGAAIETMNSSSDLTIGSAAVGTAAFWACALDEQLRVTDPTYDARRDANPDGEVLPGIRLLRNAVTHGAVVAVQKAPGVVFPIRFPVEFSHLAYRPLEDVLASWKGRRHVTAESPRQDAVYRASLEGLQLVAPLVRAYRWFDQTTKDPLGTP